MGVKTMLMASSLSDQLAFQASFSQALVQIWNQPSTSTQSQVSPSKCTAPETSKQVIREKIQEILGPSLQLGQNEGYPTVLLHFQGTICLETFAAQSAIVDIINGTPDSYVAWFTDASGAKFDEPIDAHDAVPIRVSRIPYDLAVYRNNQQVLSKHIDLTAGSIDWEVLGAPDAHQLGLGLESAADAAASVGADTGDVNSVRQLSYTAYAIAKDLPGAERVALVAGNSDANWKQNRHIAFQPMDVIRASLLKDSSPMDLEAAAIQLQRFGDLRAAADLLEEAAAKAKEQKSDQSSNLGTEAYFALTSAGEYDKAKSVRESYKLQIQDTCAACKQLEGPAIKGSLTYSQALGNLSTVKVLSNLSTIDSQAKTAP